jgi:hypothetical protein
MTKRRSSKTKVQIYEAEEGQPEWFEVKRLMISAEKYHALMELQWAVGQELLKGKIPDRERLELYYDGCVECVGDAYPIPDDALGLIFPSRTDDKKYTHGFFPRHYQSDSFGGVPPKCGDYP